MKYIAEKPVSAISSPRMVGLFSTARKYPCVEMLAKTKICRNIAPPIQLNPRLWSTKRSLLAIWMSVGNVIVTKQAYAMSLLNTYENKNCIHKQDSKRTQRISTKGTKD